MATSNGDGTYSDKPGNWPARPATEDPFGLFFNTADFGYWYWDPNLFGPGKGGWGRMGPFQGKWPVRFKVCYQKTC